MFEALPLLVDVFFLLIWVFFVFGIVGLTLFMGKMHKRCFERVYEDIILDDMSFNGTLFGGTTFNGTFTANDTSFLGQFADGSGFKGGIVDYKAALFNGTLQDGTGFQGTWFKDLSFINGTWGSNATAFSGSYFAEVMGGNTSSFDPTSTPSPYAAPALSARLRSLLKGPSDGGGGDGGDGEVDKGLKSDNFTMVIAAGFENTPCATSPPGPFRCPSRKSAWSAKGFPRSSCALSNHHGMGASLHGHIPLLSHCMLLFTSRSLLVASFQAVLRHLECAGCDQPSCVLCYPARSSCLSGHQHQSGLWIHQL